MTGITVGEDGAASPTTHVAEPLWVCWVSWRARERRRGASASAKAKAGEYFSWVCVLLWDDPCASVLRTLMTELEHGPEAFESIAKPYLPLLWRCARRLVRTGHEAEDLVQETC